MNGSTYRRLDKGPLEERVKVVIDALATNKWVLQSGEENWLIYTAGDAPPVSIPQDILDYLNAQKLFDKPESKVRH